MAKKDPEADDQDGDAAAKSSKKLLIMIVIGAFALMILSGLAVYLIMSNGGEKPPKEPEPVEEGKPKVVDDKGNPLPPLYYPVKPAFLATLPPDGPFRLLQIGIELLTYQPDMINFLTTNDPMIKHHLLNMVSTQNGEELKSRAGKEKLQAEVLEKINELALEMGAKPDLVKVYFTKLVME
jgi:flagellar FliL protein